MQGASLRAPQRLSLPAAFDQLSGLLGKAWGSPTHSRETAPPHLFLKAGGKPLDKAGRASWIHEADAATHRSPEKYQAEILLCDLPEGNCHKLLVPGISSACPELPGTQDVTLLPLTLLLAKFA